MHQYNRVMYVRLTGESSLNGAGRRQSKRESTVVRPLQLRPHTGSRQSATFGYFRESQWGEYGNTAHHDGDTAQFLSPGYLKSWTKEGMIGGLVGVVRA